MKTGKMETAAMCNINKNHLLTLFFHEGTPREEKEIQMHVSECKECRDYLLILEQTRQTLHRWNDDAPPPNTWDSILVHLSEAPETRKKPADAEAGLAVKPVLIILASIGFILALISLVRGKITWLPVREILENSWLGQFLGSFGVMAILFFFLGLFITLAITPVLMLERQSGKYRYNFN